VGKLAGIFESAEKKKPLAAFVSDALRINNEAFSSRPRPYSG
jgi:hypothetical protein